MGKDSRSKDLSNTANTAGQQYKNLYSNQTPLEANTKSQSQEMWNNYRQGVGQQTQDYSNIMGGYQDFAKNLSSPTKFGAQNVGAQNVGVDRPAELGEGYGYLRSAAPGYQNFADTGGYSDTDIQELRARGVSPIRSAYSNAMMEMNRARALGGSGGSPNYIAALSRLQRELPEQMSGAMTGVNAGLADAIRQGKLSGLAGLSGVGSTMGGLASAESGRQLQAGIANQGANLQAGIANQGADLQAQNLSEQSLQNMRNAQLASLSGQSGLYGTTPAMAATFGNQALGASGQWLNAEQMRNQQGLGLLNTQAGAQSAQTPQQPWWKQVLGAAGSIVPYLGGQNFGGNQGDWGGWSGGDMNNFNNYWDNPDQGRVVGSGL